MSNFLAGLGAALIEGGRAAGRARLERRQEELDKQNREAQLLQMALTRQNMEQGQKAFELQQEDRLYGRAKDALELAGPEGTLNPDQAALVEQAGLGFRLGPQQEGTLSSTQFAPSMFGEGFEQTPSPGLQAGRSIIPTTEQRGAIEDRRARAAENQARERARAAVTDPRFWKMPVEQRAAVWGQTGYGGNLPQSYDELVRMGQQEHDWRMEEIAAQGRNVIGAAGVRAGATGHNQRLPIAFVNNITEIDDAIRQVDSLLAGDIPESTGFLPGMQAGIPAGAVDLLSTQFGIEGPVQAKQRLAIINLSKQLIGKGLEGGVLRKEDEQKYADILPTMSDPEAVVITKLENLKGRLGAKRETTLDNIEHGGYDVSQFPGYAPRMQTSRPGAGRQPTSPTIDPSDPLGLRR